MAHNHSHGNEHASDRRLVMSLALNLLLTIVEVAAGLFSGSLALVADAVHNLSDCGSFVIALVARRGWPVAFGRFADVRLSAGGNHRGADQSNDPDRDQHFSRIRSSCSVFPSRAD